MISPVAIGVAAGLGSLIVAFFLIRLYLWARKKSSSNPLPPVQMLAHQRLKQQEVYHSQANYADHLQALSPTVDAPGPYGYDSSSSRAQTPDFRGNFEQQHIPSSNASCTSSRVELVSSETHLERPLSVAHSSTRHLSMGSSLSTLPSARGPPHKRMTRIDVVLPAPLAADQNTSGAGQRVSLYDQWTPPLSRSASAVRASVESGSSWRPSREDVPPVPPVPSFANPPTEARTQQ